MQQLDSRFVKVAHDPGDPVLCSHCPFCGSGQITGRSDGGIDCAFCGQSFIVRVQPAFPGMPQAPGMGAPTDIGPDMMGGMPMDPGMEGGGMPPGMEEEGMPPGEEDEGAPPFGDGGDEEGDSGAPPFGGGGDEDASDSGPPPPSKGKGKGDKKKSKSKKESARRYRTIAGDLLTEDQYVRHLAVMLSGGHPTVLATLRREAAARGDAEYAGHYNRGWRASQGGQHSATSSPLERADGRNEPKAWYDGYLDYASDRPKFHSRDCTASNHGSGSCTLMREGASVIPAREYEPGYDSEREMQDWMNELRSKRSKPAVRGGPELDPDTEAGYRAEKADYSE